MRKISTTLTTLLLPLALFAQKMSEVGMNVRINEADKSIVAEIRPVSGTPALDPLQTYYWYGSAQIHHTQGSYSGHLLNGTYNEYYLNKNLKEQGTFSKGCKTGTWRSWNENGVLKQLITYRAGIMSGPFGLYDDNGKPLKAGNYANNELDGKITFYTHDSVRTVTYKKGKAQPQYTGPSFWDRIDIFKKHRH